MLSRTQKIGRFPLRDLVDHPFREQCRTPRVYPWSIWPEGQFSQPRRGRSPSAPQFLELLINSGLAVSPTPTDLIQFGLNPRQLSTTPCNIHLTVELHSSKSFRAQLRAIAFQDVIPICSELNSLCSDIAYGDRFAGVRFAGVRFEGTLCHCPGPVSLRGKQSRNFGL